nr:hypothetical protein [Thermanaerosceptrum fracticalcis]
MKYLLNLHIKLPLVAKVEQVQKTFPAYEAKLPYYRIVDIRRMVVLFAPVSVTRPRFSIHEEGEKMVVIKSKCLLYGLMEMLQGMKCGNFDAPPGTLASL